MHNPFQDNFFLIKAKLIMNAHIGQKETFYNRQTNREKKELLTKNMSKMPFKKPEGIIIEAFCRTVLWQPNVIVVPNVIFELNEFYFNTNDIYKRVEATKPNVIPSIESYTKKMDKENLFFIHSLYVQLSNDWLTIQGCEVPKESDKCFFL